MTSSFDPRITAYFGDAVLRAGFVAVPHLLLRHYQRLGLTTPQAMFVLQLMESTWDLAEPPRTSGDLAARMGVDKRTIRRYSEEIAALGLLTLYEQFDANGAQIGNGYDLSPLFARLAELAPEPRPDGVAVRRPRTTPTEHAPSGATDVSVVQTGTQARPSPGHQCPPSPRTPMSALPPDTNVRPGEDRNVHQGVIMRSGLKATKKPDKKQQEGEQQEMLLSAEPLAIAPGIGSPHTETAAGWSLRRNRPLAASEVEQSAAVLRTIGVEQPVRGIVAPSLAPADAWALCAYGRARRWSVGLVIAQVYDRATRTARVAEDLPDALDALGSALAGLPAEHAQALLDAALAAVAGPPGGTTPELQRALQAAWPVLHPTTPRRLHADPGLGPSRGRDPLDDGGLWARVCQRLAGELSPPEHTTWIAGTRLLALSGNEAIVGTNNIFARDHVEAHYRTLLEATLDAETGYAVRVEVVIDSV